jgi:hypothetical protein
MVGRVGLEPTTLALKVRRSTDRSCRPDPSKQGFVVGGPGGSRTHNPRIKSAPLDLS